MSGPAPTPLASTFHLEGVLGPQSASCSPSLPIRGLHVRPGRWGPGEGLGSWLALSCFLSPQLLP